MIYGVILCRLVLGSIVQEGPSRCLDTAPDRLHPQFVDDLLGMGQGP